MDNKKQKECYFCGKKVSHIYEYCYLGLESNDDNVMCNTCIKAFNMGYAEGKNRIIEEIIKPINYERIKQ